MINTRVVVSCVACREYWLPDAEAATCTNPDHDHQQHEMHVHCDAVVLPDGTEVTAASFDPVDPYSRRRLPGYGLYFDPRWMPPWPYSYVEWPDFGVPDDLAAMLATVRSALDRARSGHLVEIGCFGGHGRTGTALACLAVLAGHDPDDAVAWVRARYCSEAIETPDQREFVKTLRR